MSSFPSGTALAILAMRDAIMISTESWQNIPSFSVGRTFGNGGFSWIFYLYVGFVGAVQEIFSLLCCVPPCPKGPWAKLEQGAIRYVIPTNRSGIDAEVFRSGNMSLAAIPRASQDAFRPLYSSFEIAMFNWCLEIKNIELTKINQPIFNVFLGTKNAFQSPNPNGYPFQCFFSAPLFFRPWFCSGSPLEFQVPSARPLKSSEVTLMKFRHNQQPKGTWCKLLRMGSK